MALLNKRTNDIIEDDGSLKKRKVLDTLSEEGPLTQEDVVYFQKEAIFRKLTLYKEELAIVQRSLLDWKSKCKINSEKLSILDSWWINLIEILSSKGLTTSKDLESIENNRDKLFILDELQSNDKAKIDDLLLLRKRIVVQIIDPLLKSTSADGSIDLHGKIESLLKDLSAERAKGVAIKQENQILSRSVEDLKFKFLNLVRENNRLTSKTLKRTDESLIEDVKDEQKEAVSEHTEDAKLKTATPNGVSANGKLLSDNGSENKKYIPDVSDEKVENLIIELNQLKTNVNSLTKQLAEESSKCLTFKQQTSNYEFRLLNLTEDDLQTSMVYKNLLNKVDKLANENLELTRKDSTLLNKISCLECSHAKIKEEFESKALEDRKLLQTQLEKAESDLARVRANRDELIGKLEVIKADKKSKELYDELLKLVESQKEEIRKLKDDSKRELLNTNPDDVPVETLKKQNQALIIELKDIETAFNSAQSQLHKKLESAVVNENYITKLKLEKNKADQKYFAAMRAKDSLGNELKTLKIQQARANELITQLKDLEKISQSKVKMLEGNLENFKNISVEKTKESDILKNKSSEILKSFDNLKKKYDLLSNEKKMSVVKAHENEEQIKALHKELDQLKSKNSSIEKLISKYRKKGDNSDFKEDDRIEGLISIAKCSICSVRFKNTALKSCGHVFCSECVNDRLAARLRKCPSCNCAFSHNDLLSVHL